MSRLSLIGSLSLLWLQTAWLSAQSPVSLTEKLSTEPLAELAAAVEQLGDPTRGAIAFYRSEMNCAKCHEADTSGRRLGPNLAQRRNTSLEQLVLAVLQPSHEIKEGYETTLIELEDGRTISGIVASEDEQSLWLDRIEEPTQPLQIPVDQIERRRQSATSTMPTELANQLGDRTEFLDLIRYLHEIADRGEVAAAQLRPIHSTASLPPLPAYENQLDHAGLIQQWNADSLRMGEEIYRLRCASCHGTLDAEGSMPTSLRFAEGEFKHGSDPYAMYRTLTHGYGMMNSQRWMVPRQKYAVIQYIREHFLRPHNPALYTAVSGEYLSSLPAGRLLGPEPLESTPWQAMDYGPSLNNTIEVSNDRSNIAQKGIAIRLDDGPGGVAAGSHWLLYEHDTMRVAGAWSGRFIDYNGIHFNGVHGQHPTIDGGVHFKNATGPGWGNPYDGSFVDNRMTGRDGRHYGPFDRTWMHFQGMYRYGRQTILQYTVGATQVFESPSLRFAGSRPIFTRSLNLGARDCDLVVQVAELPDHQVELAGDSAITLIRPIDGVADRSAFDSKSYVQIADGDAFDTTQSDFTIVARIKTEKDGTIWCKTKDQSHWLADGQTFFIRGGRLAFDIGWVGVVQSPVRVADGEWHDVAMTWTVADHRVQFFVDGKSAGGGELAAKQSLDNSVVRLGFTNGNFPNPSFFEGEILAVSFYQRAFDEQQLSNLNWIEQADDCLAHWELNNESVDPNSRFPIQWIRSAETNEPAGIVARFTSNLEATPCQWIWGRDGVLRLKIPAGQEPLRVAIHLGTMDDLDQHSELNNAMAAVGPPVDLLPLTQGGPANWPDEIEAEISPGADAGPFAVDTLTHPQSNPWNCRMRFSGVDFADDDTAVLCTWDGSVWIVSGILGNSPDKKLVWRRMAAGLFQPLGLKIRDGVIYVACRDAIVALHDLNGDGEADWYENFNSDHQVTEHFHEFAMGLQIDNDGNFYYAKSARHALPAIVPHHGTLLKVSADGDRTKILATGFRAANGVCLNDDGTFFVTDQEGHWTPKNRINWVRPGGFYGNMFGFHSIEDSSDTAMEPPVCWITNAIDRSPAELMWVDSDAWGPLNGMLLNTSYGYGMIYVVPHESIGDQMQGGVSALPIPQFPTGLMRGRFHDADGQLYGCGLFGWSSTQEQPGGFYRIRYTGRPVYVPTGLRARSRSIEITFSGELDREHATDVGNFAIQSWRLRRSASYGSDHLDQQELQVTEVTVSADGRTVVLTVPHIQPTHGMEIAYALRGADGTAFSGKIHNTIHQLNGGD